MKMPLSNEDLMRLALTEAKKAGREVRPNPMVGCAIECSSGEVFLGYHEIYGQNHAEKNAINNVLAAGKSLSGARIAITLEPCFHHGKTPPCVDLLVQYRWSQILVGCVDPNPLVQGKSLQKLRDQGLVPALGFLEKECRDLNRQWMRAHEMGRAHVTLKMATSLDGKWSSNDGSSQWITSEGARARAHELREDFDAIVTSGETVRTDNPSFTARFPDGKLRPYQPKIYVLSKSKELALGDKKLSKHPSPVEVLSPADLSEFLRGLLKKGEYHVLLEAGPTLSQLFIEAGLVDEIHLFMESQLLGGQQSRSFRDSFGGGGLPGYVLSLEEVDFLGKSSLFMRLRPKAYVVPT